MKHNDSMFSVSSAARRVTDALSGVAVLDEDFYREFDFSDQDFSRVRNMILKVAGISLATGKQSMVYSRLARRLRAVGVHQFSTYLDALEGNASAAEWEHFINALTTNLTSFYRESHHFEMLKTQLQGLPAGRRVELWCSAASTGEEPYTLAITAMEAFQSMNPPVRIVASDIDTRVLEQARKGVYQPDQLDKVPSDVLRKYFSKSNDGGDGPLQVKPEVQALVSFRRINLMDASWGLRPGFDAIFCRNVMIYFEKDVQLQVLKRFAPLLNEGGLLYAGHSENFSMASDYFTLRGKTVYSVNEGRCNKSARGSSL